MGHTKGSPEREVHSDTGPEREVHSDTGLPKKDRNISDKQPNPASTRTRGTTNKAQSK